MITWCYIVGGILGAIVLLYGLLEIHYFLRMCLCVLMARFVKKKSNILEITSVTGVCLTTDVDTLLYHMNNARYLRELDFARVDFYERTNLYRQIIAKGGSVFQGAATIRYRRFIRPFTIFNVTSQIVYWDDDSIFMEHRFISPADNFIRCVALCRQRVINCSAEEIMNILIDENIGGKNSKENRVENGDVQKKIKPEVPLEVLKWIESNTISSNNLRNIS